MNKIGLILCCFNEKDFISDCLKSWIEFRKTNPLLISVLDVCFDENGTGNSTDGSLELLTEYQKEGKIDYFQSLWTGLKEHEARNVALKWLLNEGAETILSVGVDEFYKLEEIKQIFEYVNREEFIAVFKIPYKNYTFSRSQYTLGFCPHRIWRVSYNGWKVNSFAWDDDIDYVNDKGEKVLDRNLPIKTVPGINISHYSWCDVQRSINKIKYQESHFQNGAGCSFRVNNGKIEFNLEYFKKTGQSIPEIYKDVHS